MMDATVDDQLGEHNALIRQVSTRLSLIHGRISDVARSPVPPVPQVLTSEEFLMKSPRSTGGTSPRRLPMLVARALYDYATDNPDCLSFKEGQVLFLDAAPASDEWWHAENAGTSGWVPSSYVRLYTDEEARELLAAENTSVFSSDYSSGYTTEDPDAAELFDRRLSSPVFGSGDGRIRSPDSQQQQQQHRSNGLLAVTSPHQRRGRSRSPSGRHRSRSRSPLPGAHSPRSLRDMSPPAVPQSPPPVVQVTVPRLNVAALANSAYVRAGTDTAPTIPLTGSAAAAVPAPSTALGIAVSSASSATGPEYRPPIRSAPPPPRSARSDSAATLQPPRGDLAAQIASLQMQLAGIDKQFNADYSRIREWYSWHYPELGRIITDPLQYIRVVHRMGNRDDLVNTNLSDLLLPQLDDAVRSSAVLSMGTSLNADDIAVIRTLCEKALDLLKVKAEITAMLESLMRQANAYNTAAAVRSPVVSYMSDIGSAPPLQTAPNAGALPPSNTGSMSAKDFLLSLSDVPMPIPSASPVLMTTPARPMSETLSFTPVTVVRRSPAVTPAAVTVTTSAMLQSSAMFEQSAEVARLQDALRQQMELCNQLQGRTESLEAALLRAKQLAEQLQVENDLLRGQLTLQQAQTTLNEMTSDLSMSEDQTFFDELLQYRRRLEAQENLATDFANESIVFLSDDFNMQSLRAVHSVRLSAYQQACREHGSHIRQETFAKQQLLTKPADRLSAEQNIYLHNNVYWNVLRIRLASCALLSVIVCLKKRGRYLRQWQRLRCNTRCTRHLWRWMNV
eukprot:TRINITY_DN3861_c0_g1_i3.p1 TRINITY_DN3861_c0_g1~~TRINITY_DN3861_c0_g1_i3.p1  ORF type:complete len:791 (+),score=178.80 TRINITY_DN3861_c0_g1_i3:110-2482(+)